MSQSREELAGKIARLLEDEPIRELLAERGWRVDKLPEPQAQADAAEEGCSSAKALIAAVGKRKRRLKAHLLVADVREEGDMIEFAFPDSCRYQKAQVEKPENLSLLQETASDIAGRPMEIRCAYVDTRGLAIAVEEEEILEMFNGRLG